MGMGSVELGATEEYSSDASDHASRMPQNSSTEALALADRNNRPHPKLSYQARRAPNLNDLLFPIFGQAPQGKVRINAHGHKRADSLARDRVVSPRP
jgi:hypothetical protein